MANLFGVQKKEIIMKLVSVSEKDSVTFWKLYDDYLQKNKTLTKQRIQLYEQTARSYNTMTPGAADSLARRYFMNRDEAGKKLEEYYAKIKTATNAVAAFEFYQAENLPAHTGEGNDHATDSHLRGVQECDQIKKMIVQQLLPTLCPS
jgi:hypothetical protein